MNRVVSADWVLPVEGPPIEDGAVAIEDGRIAAVGTSEELGEGTRYDDAVIVPGFVNAHSHLEYAVYGGFGDGLGDFSEWIALHIQRKARIGWDEFVDIAKLGAAECLASGVTTVGRLQLQRRRGDRVRRARPARDRLPRGLRLRSRRCARTLRRDPRPRRATRSPSACGPASLRTLRTRCRSTLYEAVRGARPADRDAHLREPFRGRVPPDRRRRVGRLQGSARRRAGRDAARDCSPSTACSDRTSSPRTASSSTMTRSASWRDRHRRRPLSPLERCARLRRRAAGRAPRGRRSASASAPTARLRRPRSTSSRSSDPSFSPRGRGRPGLTSSRLPRRSSSGRSAPRGPWGSTRRPVRSSRGSGPTSLWFPSRALRIYPGRTPPGQLCSAGRPIACLRRMSTGKSATRREG